MGSTSVGEPAGRRGYVAAVVSLARSPPALQLLHLLTNADANTDPSIDTVRTDATVVLWLLPCMAAPSWY